MLHPKAFPWGYCICFNQRPPVGTVFASTLSSSIRPALGDGWQSRRVLVSAWTTRPSSVALTASRDRFLDQFNGNQPLGVWVPKPLTIAYIGTFHASSAIHIVSNMTVRLFVYYTKHRVFPECFMSRCESHDGW